MAPKTAGRAGLVVLVAIALAAAGALVLALSRHDPARADGPIEAGRDADATQVTSEGPNTGARRLVDPAASNDAGSEVGRTQTAEPGLGDTPGRPDRDPRRFRGAGELRGHVEVYGDMSFPRSWKLVLGPSNVLAGREHAEERVLEFHAGEQDFEVLDLPFAGYDVRADAIGLNGRVQPVLLDRRSPSAFLNLQLVPAGFIEGFVYDDQAVPLEDVPLTLVSMSDASRSEARTDTLGHYRFDQVLDGAYELFLGHPDAPLQPAKRLRMQGPSLTFPTWTLTGTMPLSVIVLDSDGEPVEGAIVRGSGSKGGWIDGVTDAEGRLLVPHLIPGRYRVRAEHPDGPERGTERRSFDLTPPTLPTGRREETFRLRP